MKKYFVLDTQSGDLRLRFIGKFEFIGEAIEHIDIKSNKILWVLAEEDFRNLMFDFENSLKQIK